MDPRPGLMDGRARPAIRWGLVAVGLLTLLVVVACDSGSADTAPSDTSNSSSTPNPAAAPTSTTTTFPTTTTTTLDMTDDADSKTGKKEHEPDVADAPNPFSHRWQR